MFGQPATAKEKLEFTYGAPSFTPDSQKLVFDRYPQSGEPRIHVLNLKTNALTYYEPPAGQMWFSGKFSPSGKQMVFVMVPLFSKDLPATGSNRDYANSQIAIMDADGKNVRMLTQGPGYKKAPNFSWSGKKVIFVKAELRKPGSKTLDTHNDVHEIHVETGATRQLTNFEFFQMGRPSYLPGDKEFVVNADTPMTRGPMTVEESKDWWESMRQMQAKNHSSEVRRFHANPQVQTLQPLFIDPFYYARNVAVDALGNLYFEAQPSKQDRTRVYRSAPDGGLESWAVTPHLQPRSHEISPDGRLWVQISRPALDDDLNGIFALDLTDGTWREIPANGPAQRINP